MPTKTTSKRDKKLTDFFGQGPSSPSVLELATSSSTVGKTTMRGSVKTRASRRARDRDCMNSSAPLQVCSAPMVTRKRARSSDSSNPRASPHHPSKLKSPKRTRKTFESHSEPPKAAAHVASPIPRKSLAERRAPVRIQNNSSIASPVDHTKRVVHSSQSDEQELTLPIPESRELGKVVDSVRTWRRRTFGPSCRTDPCTHQDCLELDPLSSSPIRDPSGANTWISSSQFDTPRRSEAISRGGTTSQPQTLDSALHSLPDPNDSPAIPPITRVSTRTRKPAPAFRLPLTIVESSTMFGGRKTASHLSNRKKSQAMNPLHALLCEKDLEDKRGTGCVAVRLAEEAIAQDSSVTSADSNDDLDTLHLPNFADEQAAWKAVNESFESNDHSAVEDFTFGDRESKMLGVVTGEAINKILSGDKDSRGKEGVQNMDQKMTLGVPFWMQPLDEDVKVDSVSIPPLSGHPILTCVDGFLRSGDDSLSDLILRAGVLATVPSDILKSNMPNLLAIALFASPQICDAVSIALRDVWDLNRHHVQMPFNAILSALVRLGASPSALKGLGLVSECAQTNHVTRRVLLQALERLFAIVMAAGFAGAFSSDDVTNVVLSLVFIGLDPLISRELCSQLNITVDVICNHGVPDYLLHDIYEKVMKFASGLATINKARLVSLFASGSGRTRQISRRLAYGLLVSVSNAKNDQVPPLEPLILLLSPDAGSHDLFDVTTESTDYEELIHYVNILSVALVDIAPYVQDEHNFIKFASSSSVQGSPGKPKIPPIPPLELLRRVLEVLQGKIVDTRAAHLDRSRTKAAIQRLTMRIYYDRMALMGVRSRRRASTLKAYFSPQHR